MTEAPWRNDVAPGAGRGDDLAPLSRAQVGALGRAVGRELGWGLRQAARERARWRLMAERIPDPQLRADALGSLKRKQHYSDGAALFWTLPDQRDLRLLRLLVAFQVAADFLDHASERGAAARGSCGESLMKAFVDAVDIGRATRDYYGDHPWCDDGGYLRALVSECRAGCAALAGYQRSQQLLRQEAWSARALELEHDPDPERRDAALRALAVELDGSADEHWIELAGAASSGLTVIVLLALSADERATLQDLDDARRAYQWVGGLATMLDGYVDSVEDAATGAWSSVAYYPTASAAAVRIEYLIRRTLAEVATLRNADRHRVIVCAMIAMYLSHGTARRGELAALTPKLEQIGGTLPRLLLPPLRMWRHAYRQHMA